LVPDSLLSPDKGQTALIEAAQFFACRFFGPGDGFNTALPGYDLQAIVVPAVRDDPAHADVQGMLAACPQMPLPTLAPPLPQVEEARLKFLAVSVELRSER
jgi:hypothetical protein